MIFLPKGEYNISCVCSDPAAGFIDYFRGKHLVVINKSDTAKAVSANLSINAPIGEIMSGIEV